MLKSHDKCVSFAQSTPFPPAIVEPYADKWFRWEHDNTEFDKFDSLTRGCWGLLAEKYGRKNKQKTKRFFTTKHSDIK